MDWLPLSLSTTRHNGLFFTMLSDRGERTRGGCDAPGGTDSNYGLINPSVVPKALVGDNVRYVRVQPAFRDRGDTAESHSGGGEDGAEQEGFPAHNR
ncbi:hypothetical protein GCM10011583_12610 [Streptomyces camponoticapitis]|uniref:Uncharacterized protein n=1 Tax=Streptomyces camponoticapitis TaxID=1616125 RepID=A0ABQ2E046_9ACTN|nr:hypothetical protein GCM10011583_12610 [Streptomyces camponoticapitis]